MLLEIVVAANTVVVQPVSSEVPIILVTVVTLETIRPSPGGRRHSVSLPGEDDQRLDMKALPDPGKCGLRVSTGRDIPVESHARGERAALRATLPGVELVECSRGRHDTRIARGEAVVVVAAIGVVGAVLRRKDS